MAVFNKLLLINILFCIGNVISSDLTIPPECIHDYVELWPHINPNSYWYCETTGSTPVEMQCPEGRGFLRIEDKVSGCIPWEDWDCTTKDGPPNCTDENYYKPHRHVNPNKFWACTEATPEHPSIAVEADCLDFPVTDPPTKGSRGFVDNKNNLGCIPWEHWVCKNADDKNRE